MPDNAEIKRLNAQLREQAHRMPRFPTDRLSAENFEQWQEGCREIERQIREQGVEI